MGIEGQITDDLDRQAAVFDALSDPTRLRLVKLLKKQQNPGALCVNALAGLLGISQSAVSQHMRVLKAAGLVKGERRGYHIHYFLNGDMLEEVCNLLKQVLMAEEQAGSESCLKYCTEGRK